MSFEKPTEQFSTQEEAFRWFIRAHFKPTRDQSKQTWASDLYATYLAAVGEIDVPLVTANRFGRFIRTMLAHDETTRLDDGERRSGRIYAIEPLEGVEVYRLGAAGKDAVHELYRNALKKIGGRAPDGQESIKRENDDFVKRIALAGFLSTIPRARKLAGVDEPVNEARVEEALTTELFEKATGQKRLAPLRMPPGYNRFVALLGAHFVVARYNNGRRSKYALVERRTG